MATTTNAVAPFGVAGSQLTGNGVTTLPTMKGGLEAVNVWCSTAQSIADSVVTKIQLDTEIFDTGSRFDSATNYRYSPNVAGIYAITGCLSISPAGILLNTLVEAIVKKNGSEVGQIFIYSPAISDYVCCTFSTLVTLNGSTDYIELYGFQTSGSTVTVFNDLGSSFLCCNLVEPT